MSVLVHESSGRVERFDDDESGRYSYQVGPSGVLIVLRSVDSEEWSVLWEYALSAWAKVQGMRFSSEADHLGGADGKAHQRAAGL
ncbi:hypothetical protein [Arthrobacter sp. ISL-5]|uniref:hypothetical protein n=1 Tax=Arthrobacter sp. ISL-5 TaxID=2819111 RepID=UPI001BE7CA3E|nr:hypothetical protein [Arthrobacter sp. ISL-5]MBT2555488.1 hypothetical protein [Arthrobacter sp. ISL-5]